MEYLQQLLLAIVQVALLCHAITNAETMEEILVRYDQEAKELCNKNVKASWAVQTDVNNSTLVEEMVRVKATN